MLVGLESGRGGRIHDECCTGQDRAYSRGTDWEEVRLDCAGFAVGSGGSRVLVMWWDVNQDREEWIGRYFECADVRECWRQEYQYATARLAIVCEEWLPEDPARPVPCEGVDTKKAGFYGIYLGYRDSRGLMPTDVPRYRESN